MATGEGVTPRIEKWGKKGGNMKVWKKAPLVKGWQKIRGAERNRKEKAGKRQMYETPTARGRKKMYTSGTQVNF